jgi:hypothetical protein
VSGIIPPNPDQVQCWQGTWQAKFEAKWVVGLNGKYYPKRPPKKCGRKDIDELDIATVR